MAKEGRKTSQIACTMDHDVVTFLYQIRNDDDSLATVETATFDTDLVKDIVYENGESFLAYGVRAWLADRTSQFRKVGSELEVLKAMQEYWAMATDPTDPRWNQKRASGTKASIDPAMVRLIAELAGISEAVAMENVKKVVGDRISYHETPYDAANGADCILIATEWPEFRAPDFALLSNVMKTKVIFDGRNLYELRDMIDQGFTYYSIGRQSINV